MLNRNVLDSDFKVYNYNIISINSDQNYKDTHYDVVCDCGAKKVTTLSSMKQSKGYCRNCKKQHVEFIPKKFGKLTTTPETKKINNNTYIKCDCDCGNSLFVASPNLVSGIQKSCGCSKNIKTKKINKKRVEDRLIQIQSELDLITSERENTSNSFISIDEGGDTLIDKLLEEQKELNELLKDSSI